MPFFFFSYARRDRVDSNLIDFYDDLRNELATRMGTELAETGYLDIRTTPGAPWAERIADELNTCQVFVPAYSPLYFQSDNCGREWHAFMERLKRGANGPPATTRIVPVWWVPPTGPLPHAVRPFEDTRDHFGAEYREYGLRYLKQLKENEGKYKDFLVKFTGMLMAAANPSPLPPGRAADLVGGPSAFMPTVIPVGAAAMPAAGGPRRVHFVIVAANQHEMRQHRSSVDYYGGDSEEWSPYYPDHTDPIALHAQGVAQSQRLIFSLVRADALVELLDRARHRHEVVVLIVDSWATRIQAYQALLAEYDRRRPGTAAVLVPWNAADAETAGRRDELRGSLWDLLGNCTLGDTLVFREDIGTMEQFEAALSDVIVEIRSRIITREQVVRRATGGEHVPQPLLAGPGA